MKIQKTAAVILFIVSVFILQFSATAIAGQPEKQDTKVTPKDMKRETLEAVRAIKQYSANQKDKAVKEIKSVLAHVDYRIDQMQHRVEKEWDSMDQASRKKARETMTGLRRLRNNLSEWYGRLEHGSAGAWGDVKDGFLNSYEVLTNAFDKAETEFSSNMKGENSDR